MLLAFLEMLLMWGFHAFQFSLLWMVTPRYLVLSTNCSMDCILRLYYVFTFVGYAEHLTLVRVQGHEPLCLPPLQAVQVVLENIVEI